jgi:hypothetical protein
MGGIDEPSLVTTEPSTFRRYLPDLSSPRFANARDQDAYEYVAEFRRTQRPAALFKLTQAWENLLEEPFTGVTTDGALRLEPFNVTPIG